MAGLVPVFAAALFGSIVGTLIMSIVLVVGARAVLPRLIGNVLTPGGGDGDMQMDPFAMLAGGQGGSTTNSQSPDSGASAVTRQDRREDDAEGGDTFNVQEWVEEETTEERGDDTS